MEYDYDFYDEAATWDFDHPDFDHAYFDYLYSINKEESYIDKTINNKVIVSPRTIDTRSGLYKKIPINK